MYDLFLNAKMHFNCFEHEQLNVEGINTLPSDSREEIGENYSYQLLPTISNALENYLLKSPNLLDTE